MLTPDQVTYIERMTVRYREMAALPDEGVRESVKRMRAEKEPDPRLNEGLDVPDNFWARIALALAQNRAGKPSPSPEVRAIRELPQFPDLVEAASDFNKRAKATVADW